MDEQYVRNNHKIPTRKDYPTAPPALFTNLIVGTMHNIGNNILKLRTDYEVIGANSFRCTVHCVRPDGETETAAAEGFGKQAAARAAYLLMLSKLHEAGALKELFLPSIDAIDKQTLRDEVDAKADIYNYAARFGFIPQFTVRNITRPARRPGKTQVEVTVELQEQGIKVTARQLDLKKAEIAAAIRFKQEAEKYHAEHGDGDIVIKDSASITTDNVKTFFDFYRLKNRGSVFEAKLEESKEKYKADGNRVWNGQVFLNGEPIGSLVTMTNKKKAEELARLVAATSLLQKDPELMAEFQGALSPSGAILMPLRPIDMEMDPDAITIMQETLRDVRNAGLSDRRTEVTSDEDTEATKSLRTKKPLTEHEAEMRSKTLEQRLKAFNNDDELAELRAKKESLPMSQYRDKVISHIGNNQYSVIVGATGSGKTTQVPQILLEDAIAQENGAKCNIICTQPRRIAATSVARRVATERNEQLQDTVGYHVRFDPKLPKHGGSITYCTTGILLKQLQQAPDEVFDRVSHIVVDEVHERDILIDFLLIIIKEAVHARRRSGKSTPKVVLMSATINSELFGQYFEEKLTDGQIIPCPSLSVPGRTFPVKEKYFENIVQELETSYPTEINRFLLADISTKDYMSIEGAMSKTTRTTGIDDDDQVGEATIDWKRERTVTADGQVANEKEDALVPVNLVAATIAHISKTTKEGAILVFLPGFDEIKKIREAITTHSPLGIDFNDNSSYKLFTLHSSVPAAEQAEVFNPVPEGCRKIILSTNIAETSVTIPDIQHVVDTGKLREKRYDQVRRITKLQCTWISQSNAKQRAGRAGRVRNGNYYALYSRSRHESLRAIGLPEMLRSDLSEICLDIKAQAFQAPIRDFLARAIEPPQPEAVEVAVQNLKSLEALTEDEKLTALGRLLASLPVHPALGKMIILGVIFRCLDPMIILGAALNERSLFVNPPDKRRESAAAQARFLDGSDSDHYALVNAFTQMRAIKNKKGQSAGFDFAIRNFLHMGAYRTIESTTHQIEDLLVEAGLIPWTHPKEKFEGELGHPKLNKNSSNIQVVKALLLAGTHPNLAAAVGRTFRTPGEKNAIVHPSSLNSMQNFRTGSERNGAQLYTYSTMVRSADGNSIMLRDTTASTPLSATLFGGKLKATGSVIEMDGWLPFYVKSQYNVVRTIMEFRKAMDRVSVLSCCILILELIFITASYCRLSRSKHSA